MGLSLERALQTLDINEVEIEMPVKTRLMSGQQAATTVPRLPATPASTLTDITLRALPTARRRRLAPGSCTTIGPRCLRGRRQTPKTSRGCWTRTRRSSRPSQSTREWGRSPRRFNTSGRCTGTSCTSPPSPTRIRTCRICSRLQG